MMFSQREYIMRMLQPMSLLEMRIVAMMVMKTLQDMKVQDIIHVEQFYQVSTLWLTITMYAFAEHQVIFNVQLLSDTYIDRERS